MQKDSLFPLKSVLFLSVILLFTASQCNSGRDTQPVTDTDTVGVQRWTATIEQRYPHRRDAFTQGLLLYQGDLYESDGLSARYGGQSSLRRVEPNTGKVQQIHHVDDKYFAEGLARVDDELIQLTWQAGKAFVYALDSFAAKREIAYQGEGWGLCFDGTALYMSDGSATLFKRNAETFAIEARLPVTLENKAVERLNELECVGDHVYANVWQTTDIVRINKDTGVVDAVIDASGLLEAAQEAAKGERIDVLNGIAYDAATEHFYVTGKLWPLLFEVSW